MKKLLTFVCILFALSTSSFAQHYSIRITEDERQSNTYKVGDVIKLGNEFGIVYTVTSDGRHGKAISISSNHCDWYEACDWCAQLGGYWELPSKNELKLIYNAYKNNRAFRKAVKSQGGWEDSWWWSGEVSSRDNKVWCVAMSNGNTSTYPKVYDIDWYVRAVSAF